MICEKCGAMMVNVSDTGYYECLECGFWIYWVGV